MSKKKIGCMGWIMIILFFPLILGLAMVALGFAMIGAIIYGMVYCYKNGKFDNITTKTNELIGKLYNKVFKKELSKPILSPKGFTIIATILIFLLISAFGSSQENLDSDVADKQVISESIKDASKEETETDTSKEETDTSNEETETSHIITTESTSNNKEDIFDGYKIIEVDGGNLSGHREPNVAVDIGFGDREYWAFTNEYGQLVKVVAKQIILQDDSKEPVNSSGRYYPDEAKVPGVESKSLDEGHVIADSLGGVSNAYNITPQNSTLNRHGDQAYMEKAIRDAGGCTDFVAIITYPNTKTHIPSHYSYTYTIKGNVVNDEFDNINPDEYNSSLESNTSTNNSGNTSSKVDNTTNNSNTTSNSTNESQSSANSSEIVYWTPNGKSYHTTKNCSTLSRSKTILNGTIKESGKYDQCDRCH